MKARISLLLISASVAAFTALGGPAAAAPTVEARLVAGGLDAPVAFAFGPSDALWYVEKGSGEIRTIDLSTGRDTLFARVPGVDASGERGMLGIALHPRFPSKPFVYVYVTRSAGGRLRNQILRIDEDGRRVIFSSPASPSAYHNGGRILFGPDDMLYAVVGDGHAPANSQDPSDHRGKILRMTPRGKIPPSNPRDSLVFASGIRNSFGLAFDPLTGRLWETENGPECNDELNRIRAGRNYGWGPSATCEGDGAATTNRDGPRPVRPELLYPQPIGITGIAFCRGCGLGEGRAFFGAVNTGAITRVALDPRRMTVERRAVAYEHVRGVLSVEVGPDGSLYFSDMTAIWRLARA